MIPSLVSMVRDLSFVRLAGTQSEQDAASLIERWISALGFKVTMTPFPIENFSDGTASIEIEGKVLNGIPFGRCADSTTTAELIYTENPKVVNLSPEHHRGKILLTYGSPRGIYHELKDAGIAGIITITPPFKEAWSLSHRQYEENVIPSMTVTYDDAAKLASLSGKTATVKIQQKTHQATAYNIEVDIPGTHPDGSITYFVGHYDSVARSPGACDNAGGSAVLVQLAKHFAENPPVRDVKMIFFSGEELGLIGSQAYCDAHKDEILKRGRLVINVDVSGDDLGKDELYITGTNELLGFVGGCTRAAGVYCNTQISLYSSDSIPFAQLGVPSVNVARYGGKASFFGHTPGDAPGYITQRGLHNTYEATLAFSTPITHGKIYPVDRLIDDSLRPKLEAYLFGLKGVEPKIEWLPKYLLPTP